MSGNAACPRCGQAFHCGVNDTAPCACGSVALSPETQQQLRERYTTCLCLACLRELSARPADARLADMKKPASS